MFNTSELNRAYYDLSEFLPQYKILILYGGRNSSKTHSTMQFLMKLLWNSEHNGIWYRKYGAVLKEKAYQPFVDLAKSKGILTHLKPVFHNLKKEILFPKGNRLLFDHVEDGKSKGSANITYVIIDEIDQLSQEEFMGVITSFRGNDDIRFIFMFNPVSEFHWLKPTFFDNNKENEEPLFKRMSKRIKYTIEDNKHATESDYQVLDALKDQNKNEYNIQRLGKWGSISVEDPFIDAFNYNTHVVQGTVPFFTDYPLIISFDFGKVESCTVGQYFDEMDIESDISLSRYFTKEGVGGMTRIRDYRVGDSQSNVLVILEAIVAEFGTDVEYEIVGDTSGGSDAHSKFAEIRRLMADLGCPFTHFPRRIKPIHIASRAVTNWCLRSMEDNYKISTNCKVLINDLTSVRVDPYGNINKADCVHRNIGHLLDASRYVDFIYTVKEFYRKNSYYSDNYLGKSVTTYLAYN